MTPFELTDDPATDRLKSGMIGTVYPIRCGLQRLAG